MEFDFLLFLSSFFLERSAVGAAVGWFVVFVVRVVGKAAAVLCFVFSGAFRGGSVCDRLGIVRIADQFRDRWVAGGLGEATVCC